VVQEDFVHLLRGLSPWEGRKTWLGTAVGKPLGCPQALGGGGQQKGGPVFVFGGFACLEVPRRGGPGNFSHVWCVVFPGCSSSLVIFTTEDSQVRGPPRFGVMGRPGYWRMFFEKSYQTV